jgi:hypothetical protein
MLDRQAKISALVATDKKRNKKPERIRYLGDTDPSNQEAKNESECICQMPMHGKNMFCFGYSLNPS